MAEIAQLKIEKELSLGDPYASLQRLQRHHHVYCQYCLVPMVHPRDQQEKHSLLCPTCFCVAPYPESRGMSAVGSQSSLGDSIMEFESISLTTGRESDGAGFRGPLKREARYCSVHLEEELKLLCETCGELVCLQCIMRDGQHHDHEYMLIKKAFEKCKEEIVSSLQPLEKKHAIMRKALAQVKTCCRDIADQQTATEGKIHVTFERLREVLHVRETELISQLEQMAEGKLKGLATQRDEIETTLAQLSSCLHLVGESLRTGCEEDVLMMKASTAKQVKELGAPHNPDTLKPNANANMKFLALDVTAMCQNHGNVVEIHSPEASKCRAAGKGFKTAVVGKKATATLNCEDKQSKELLVTWDGELVSEITGTRVSCHVERKTRNQYEISYQPTVKGRHQLHIKVENQHIEGSPFSVTVKSPVVWLSAPFLTIDMVEGPWGVAVNQMGEVIVTTEGGEHCVSVFSPTGEKLRSFGTHGSDLGQFQHHRGLTVDIEGNILVVDSANHRIQKFTAEGRFLTAVGTQGSGPQQLSYPVDIALNASNKRFYIVDNDNHRIQILNSDLTFYGAFGKKGKGKRQFHDPCGIACDGTGKVYVTDRDNHRVQVFTAQGKFVRSIGKFGRGRGELDLPYFIAIDASGMVYVSEWGNNRVSVFTSEGQFVTSFGRRGKGPGEFEWPHGLAVDDCGVLYVCDGENNRVQIF